MRTWAPGMREATHAADSGGEETGLTPDHQGGYVQSGQDVTPVVAVVVEEQCRGVLPSQQHVLRGDPCDVLRTHRRGVHPLHDGAGGGHGVLTAQAGRDPEGRFGVEHGSHGPGVLRRHQIGRDHSGLIDQDQRADAVPVVQVPVAPGDRAAHRVAEQGHVVQVQGKDQIP